MFATLKTSLTALCCLIAAQSAVAEVTVFAAASLREVLEKIAETAPEPMRLSFAGSGTIARQIAAGAPADVVVLASRDWAEWLAERGLLASDQPVAVAGNALVVIGPIDEAPLSAPGAIVAALGADRLAMGHRDAVPAGTYAREWLKAQGIWSDLHDQLAETDNVRAALILVARGEAPLGVVYATDAATSPRVRVLWAIDPATHSPIRYWAGATSVRGQDTLAYLQSPAAAAAFTSHGFTSPVGAE